MIAAPMPAPLAGSMNSAAHVYAECYPGSYQAHMAQHGVTFEYSPAVREFPQPRLHFPPEDANATDIHDELVFEAIASGALTPLTPKLAAKARAAGLRTILHAHFVVPKPKPEPPPFHNSMAEARRQAGAAGVAQLLKWHRLVANFKPGLNNVIAPRDYRVRSAKTVRKHVRKGTHQFVLDAKSFYNQILMREYVSATMALAPHSSPRLRRWLHDHGASSLCYRTMAFGAAPAGYYPSAMMGAVLHLLRAYGVTVIDIMDDTNTLSDGNDLCHRADAAATVKALRAHGIALNAGKAQRGFAPLFGGRVTDTIPDRLGRIHQRIPEAWLLRKAESHWRPAMRQWLSGQPVTFETVESINGQLQSTDDCIFGGRTFHAPFSALVQNRLRGCSPAQARQERRHGIVTAAEADAAIRCLAFYCSDALRAYNAHYIHATTTADWTIGCDASKHACGWRWLEGEIDQPTSMGPLVTYMWPRAFHSLSKRSAFAEVRGLAHAALHETKRRNLRNGSLLVVTDSVCSAAALRRGGARSQTMNSILKRCNLWPTLRARNIEINAIFRPGTWMIERKIDEASRPS